LIELPKERNRAICLIIALISK